MNKIVFLFLSALFFINIFSLSYAYATSDEVYQKGLDLFTKKEANSDDYREAFSYFVEAAKAGNSDAYYMLALYSDFGISTRRKPEVAFVRYLKSAELGNTSAMFSVADMYLNGQGVEHNPEEAVKWFVKSAQGGNAEAAYNLGVIYSTGLGVSSDVSKAEHWFDESYRLGNPAAFFAKQMTSSVSLYPRTNEALKK